VTITGTGFTDATSVSIGGIAATDLTIESDTVITAVAPAHVADLSEVKVISAFGDVTQFNAYRYALAPTIIGISPSSGSSLGGTAVTIEGANFTGATGVDFGSTPGTLVTVVSDTRITVVSPAGTGTDQGITVTGPGGETTTAGAWDYISAPTAPRNLKQTAKARGSMTFTWSAPVSAGGGTISGYKVQYRKHGASTWKTKSTLQSGRSVTLGNLRDGVSYDVRVAAQNVQVGAYASLTATTPGIPAAPTRASAKVRGYVVTMKWTKAVVQSGSTRTANLIACTKGSVKKKTGRLSAGATSGSITLGKGTWSCRVFAYTEAGHGPGSTAKTITIQ
jgi:hypothetical protein